MCGIVGYIGGRSAAHVIVGGLKRLEYRGYDSAGIGVLNAEGLDIRRSPGKIRKLEALLQDRPLEGQLGLGHTRWATHGRPSEGNAHPHIDCTGGILIVHNGILENYLALKEWLAGEGHEFTSETDTEVIAHLVEKYAPSAGTLEGAVQRALREVRGAYALAVIADWAPDRIVAAKHGPGSVVIGAGDGEAFLASDIPAILPYTRDVIILEDDEMAVITRDGVQLVTRDDEPICRGYVRIDWDPEAAEKAGYPHFMLKEIHEQPRAAADTVRGRYDLEAGDVIFPECRLDASTLAAVQRVVLVACGTSYHAALVARTLIERLSGVPAEVDIASEFRYREPLVGPETLVVAVSQSGETADTLGALKVAKLRAAPTLAITNVVGSALSREASGVLYTHAGPEIGVCSTKTFVTTVIAGYLLAIRLGRARGFLSADDGRKRLDDLLEVPRTMERALQLGAPVAELAPLLAACRNFLFLGRGLNYPIALEGALKLKEISYIPAEGYPGGEMKHGPIALVDEELPVIVLVPRDSTYDRMLGNVEEIKARGGRVIAVAHAGDRQIETLANHVIPVPPAPELLAPLVHVIPLQFLAYHIAVQRGCDVDQPRNLAKSVTVE